MAFHWKTAELVEAFKKLPGIGYVEVFDYGGDYDTNHIVAGFNEESDLIYVAGYPSTDECCENRDDAVCEWIEISDGKDSRGGLNSRDVNTIMVYAQLRAYFANQNVEIINHYDEIF